MIIVLVPVLNRPKNVRPLVESFLEATTEFRFARRLLFIVQENDTAEMKEIATVVSSEFDHGREFVDSMVVPDHCVRWSQKLNAAHRELTRRDDQPSWYLLGADDLRFHKGWDDNHRLQHLMSDLVATPPGVIGTNDKGNPAVMAGKHSTHPFIRVDYIERHGIQEAAGVIAPEVYHHCFVDNEIVATARHRGAYAHCHESVIEHLHPVWRKAEKDSTYEIGSDPEKFRQDRKMFEARSALYGWPKWNEGWGE